MPKLIMLVGPPGSGKSTWARNFDPSMQMTYVNQDSQGKNEHLAKFIRALSLNENIIVDRMNFNKEQRNRYLIEAKARGYEAEIHVFHENRAACYTRCTERGGHETIKTSDDANKALDFFFKNYERVDDNEANIVIRHWPEGDKSKAVICDLDGTLCNIDHRLHWVRNEEGKKNWPMFMAGIKDDKVNTWCRSILNHLYHGTFRVVLCSGRGEEYRTPTVEWLRDNKIIYDQLFMRYARDGRKDYLIKEILLDFEILTRYEPAFFIDDRKSVVDMWRKRGYTCLQCAEGDF